MAGAGHESERWDAAAYNRECGFVWEYGRDLLELLAPQPGERILDLGCGTGHLTAEIARRGAAVTGLDADGAMLAEARARYPGIRFVEGDARRFTFDEPFDAVFSNAVLHWVKPPEQAAARIAQALRPGGRLVAELGGRGNVARIVEELAAGLAHAGSADAAEAAPWYYPSVAEYAAVLEGAGLEPVFAALFDRPTRLEGGEVGLARWVRMFGGAFLERVPKARRDAFLVGVEDRLRASLFRDGSWWADYRRLRVVALKPRAPGARPG